MVRWVTALRRTRGFQARSLAIAIAAMAGSGVTWGPASAQVYWGDRPSNGWGSNGYWGDRYPSGRYYQQAPERDFFSPFFGERYHRPSPPVDYSKAPPPRKLEKPPATTVVVIGDSLADWLAYGLDELYADEPDIGVERKIRATAGLIRYDAKNDQLDWSQVTKDALTNDKPNAIIVMLGLNDRVPIRDKAPARPEPQRKGDQPAEPQTPQNAASGQPAAPASSSSDSATQAATTDKRHVASGGTYDFHTDRWAELYAKRIDEMIVAAKSRAVRVIWVGLPALRGPKSTSDMSYLDELYRERAEKAGIVYVDIWDGFVDEQGRYAVKGPDFEGQTRRLRTADGVHFTKAGAVKLASYVDRDLRRVLSGHATPVALPGPEVNAKPDGARPAIGPVLPLTTSSSAEHGDLLGAGDPSTQTTSDPIATKILSRGDPLTAPRGRADDFSWPHPAADENAAPEVAPVALAPSTPSKKGAVAKDAGKRQVDARKNGKAKSTR
jgi:hypothetical protein